MRAYYNENDPKAAAWLRELIKRGIIADGDVDERSIEDVEPARLWGYTQCHFFAGIGVWSHVLRKSGWDDSRPVWTGSCPCQPFSSAGKKTGFDDERHLWPAFHWLIQQCKPSVVFGEQVAGKAGETWLDLVSTDLENEGYAVGSAVTAACGFGAPHQRKRLYWVGDTYSELTRWDTTSRGKSEIKTQLRGCSDSVKSPSTASSVADTDSKRYNGQRLLLWEEQRKNIKIARSGEVSSVVDTEHEQRKRRLHGSLVDSKTQKSRETTEFTGCGPTNGYWEHTEWIECTDKKIRPIEPGTFPLVNGAPARVGRLRGYGNAIVAPQAQAFIESYMECVV